MDEFFESQDLCDTKMEEVYKRFQERQERENKMKVQMSESIRLAIKRLKKYESMPWTKGDHFKFEEHDYSWLLEKVAGGTTSKYHGCQIFIPETVLFSDGKPEKVIKLDD